MNAIIDYGRPVLIILATLVERGAGQLPIPPNLVGVRPWIEPGQQVTFTGPAPLGTVIVQSKKSARPSSS